MVERQNVLFAETVEKFRSPELVHEMFAHLLDELLTGIRIVNRDFRRADVRGKDDHRLGK